MSHLSLYAQIELFFEWTFIGFFKYKRLKGVFGFVPKYFI